MPEYMLGSEIKTKILNSLGKGRKGYKEIQEETGVSSPSLNKYLKVLEEEGEIGRVEHPKDRRKKIYFLRQNSDYYKQKYWALLHWIKTFESGRIAYEKEGKKAWFHVYSKSIGESVMALQYFEHIHGEKTDTALLTYLELVYGQLGVDSEGLKYKKELKNLFSKVYKNLPEKPGDIEKTIDKLPLKEKNKRNLWDKLFAS